MQVKTRSDKHIQIDIDNTSEIVIINVGNYVIHVDGLERILVIDCEPVLPKEVLFSYIPDLVDNKGIIEP